MGSEMREIKFRAYDMATQDHWEPKPQGVIEFDVTTVPDFINHTHNENGKWERRFKIVEFTGLKDKNGVDIYEGDIVSVIDAEMDRDKEIGKVAWYNCYCPAFDVYVKACESGTGFESYNDEFNTFTMDVIIEVVGNIHQNPELLG